jgi:hypothetical protein
LHHSKITQASRTCESHEIDSVSLPKLSDLEMGKRSFCPMLGRGIVSIPSRFDDRSEFLPQLALLSLSEKNLTSKMDVLNLGVSSQVSIGTMGETQHALERSRTEGRTLIKSEIGMYPEKMYACELLI